MLRPVPIVVVALAAGAVAEPAPAPAAIDPIAVAGRYTAILAWTRCAVAGAREAVLDLRVVDRRLELELGTTRPGMPVVVVDGDAASITGTSADVTVTLRWGRRGRIAVAIDLDSGCAVRGTARRVVSGLPACDRLAALARIETGCSAIAAADRAEDVTALGRARAGWRRARGDRRREAEQACAARADALWPVLVDAACVEIPAGGAPFPIEECQDVAAQLARLARCPSLPDDLRAQLGAAQITTHLPPSVGREQLDPARAVCLDMTHRLLEIQHRFGC